MKILIIGAKGFIGQHCIAYFKTNNQVWGCDVVMDYNNDAYFIVDATNADYSDIFKETKFDVCINCSGAASVPDSIKNPQRDFILNTMNVFKQLDAIRKYNSSCKYINLSSAAVYGNPDQLPIVETQTCNPISPYGKHKKMAEDICSEFYTDFNIKTSSLRIFSAFGPGLRKQLFWDLDKKTTSNNTVSLYGSGTESRDFIYIDDLVKAIDIVIKNGDFNADIINIANGEEHQIKDVVKFFYDQYETHVPYRFNDQERKGDPNNWVADISKLKEMGYSPKTSLENGIKKYIQWLQEKA